MADLSEAAAAYMRAWATREWLDCAEKLPVVPQTIDEVYTIHDLLREHQLAASIGGHGGWKLGGIGAMGEKCICAPLFRKFMLEAPNPTFAASDVQLHTVEAEVGFEMGSDIEPRDAAYSQDEVLLAVKFFFPAIECCGRRTSAALCDALPVAGKLADFLLAGGVIVGPKVARESVDSAALDSCQTSLCVNAETVATGSPSEVPCAAPLAALTWLANHLSRRGITLRKGRACRLGARECAVSRATCCCRCMV